MIFVEPSIEIINEPDIFKRIELAGRTCYKSENKITDESAYPFYQRMVASGHLSVIEHSNIFVRTYDPEETMQLMACITDYMRQTGKPCYIRHSILDDYGNSYHVEDYGYCFGKQYLFSGNIRAWRDLIELFRGENVLAALFSDHPAFKDMFN